MIDTWDADAAGAARHAPKCRRRTGGRGGCSTRRRCSSVRAPARTPLRPSARASLPTARRAASSARCSSIRFPPVHLCSSLLRSVTLHYTTLRSRMCWLLTRLYWYCTCTCTYSVHLYSVFDSPSVRCNSTGQSAHQHNHKLLYCTHYSKISEICGISLRIRIEGCSH